MKIGFHTNMSVAGGSEMRCAILASAAAAAGHEVLLLPNGDVSDKVAPHIDPRVKVIPSARGAAFLGLDRLIVICSDSKSIAMEHHWTGLGVKLAQIPVVCFLHNFLVSTTQGLPLLRHPDIRIAVTSRRFFNELSGTDKKERYDGVRHLPRLLSRSPIKVSDIAADKTPSEVVRFGRHSRSTHSKFGPDMVTVIRVVQAWGLPTAWDLMGVPKEHREALARIDGVTVRDEYSIDVPTYLKGLDVCVYLPPWKHQEPWARSTAEAMASGCPLIAVDDAAGNTEQVVEGNSGFLVTTPQLAIDRCLELARNAPLRTAMGKNAARQIRQHTPDKVWAEMEDFLQ